jgi:hypothetical protein
LMMRQSRRTTQHGKGRLTDSPHVCAKDASRC